MCLQWPLLAENHVFVTPTQKNKLYTTGVWNHHVPRLGVGVDGCAWWWWWGVVWLPVGRNFGALRWHQAEKWPLNSSGNRDCICTVVNSGNWLKTQCTADSRQTTSKEQKFQKVECERQLTAQLKQNHTIRFTAVIRNATAGLGTFITALFSYQLNYHLWL